MSIPAIGGTSTGTPATSSATSSVGYASESGSSAGTAPSTSGFDTLGKDTFLKLMVAQLRNQDPMNPTDSTQFLAQTAQFTSLEKLEDVASQSAQALAAQMAFGASGLVGKQVTYSNESGDQVSGSVSAVTFTANGPVLKVGDADVPINNVVSVGTTSGTGTTPGAS